MLFELLFDSIGQSTNPVPPLTEIRKNRVNYLMISGVFSLEDFWAICVNGVNM